MNIYLVVLIIIAIIIFSNLAMLGAVRGSRGMKFDWLNTTKSGISRPFQKEEDQLSELRQKVEELSKTDASENKPTDAYRESK